jgi:CRP/FNR family transcriptional regulator, nitrogen oxide reductase regulator
VKDLRFLIASCPLFAGLPTEIQQRLAATARLKRLAAGEALFHQGDTATHVYLVSSGRVRLSQSGGDGGQVIVRFIGPGELFGWVAVVRGIAFPVTAEADGATRLLAWDRETMKELADRAPELGTGALALVAGRMHQLQERFLEVATQSVPQRVARALLRLEDEGCRGAHRRSSRLEMRRQDLAEMCGTTLFTVSRLLTEWRHQGWMDCGRGWVSLLDTSALERVAGGGGVTPRGAGAAPVRPGRRGGGSEHPHLGDRPR